MKRSGPSGSSRQDEFETLALPHLPGMLRTARRLVQDAATAEDLVQETFLLAWRGFDRYENGTNIRAWLFRILMNAIYGHARKVRRIPAMNSIEEQSISIRMEAGGTDVARAAEMAEAFAALSSEHRTVLLLGVVEGFTCEETAGILSVPVGTVMSRLSRARRALRERLELGERR